ncbi:hypothetical protein ABEB36_006990 [Hypothenemus hampei]|uniref:Rho guanine nucleotide exchange factor n=1 Tax=Hypothenemus hampei TaxID=57062 RepID=A0ABD1ESE4_HYPHA
MKTPQSANKELLVSLTRLTPRDITQYSGQKHGKGSSTKQSNHYYEASTPKASLELAVELKKVINERNILTSKTRKRVFECLDEMKVNTEMESRNYKRENILLEIVNSEIKYVKQLETIIEFFMKPIQEKKLLKADEYEILFGNINTIYSINKQLLEELDKGFDNMANAFSKIAPFLKLYSVYASDFRKTIKILQNARSCNPGFAKFVENQETRPEVQNKLSALLITPIQRVPRYKLLLNQLSEFTTSEDFNYELLKDCIQKINEAALHINKIVEEQENSQRLLEIQRYLRSGEINLIVPGRKLKKEGVLHKMGSKRTGHSEKFYVVLMNDLLILNKMRREELSVGSLKINCILPLNKCILTEILDKGCLKINCQDEELILYHEKFSEMLEWIKIIKQAIQEYLEDRKTLRKESSNRRPVKRKDLSEYHEVGVSPGHPLKKRKMAIQENASTITKSVNKRISARKSIHSACNSTPIKLESNPETIRLNGFPLMNTNDFSCKGDKTKITLNLQSEKTKNELKNDQSEIFVFGRKSPDEQNVSKISNFFKNFGSSIKGFLGFRGEE